MPQSYAAIYIHFVFSTKDRTPSIDPAWKQRMYDFMGGICRKRNSPLLSAGGMSDHIHLLVSLNRDVSASELMRDLKAATSKWVHDTESIAFEWQAGYAAFAVSHSNADAVRKYIEMQEEHHAKFDFKEEFIALLQKHGVDFNEAYIWA